MPSSANTSRPRRTSLLPARQLPAGQPQQLVTTPVQLGKILSSRRKALNLSQSTVAAKLGIVQSRLSVLEDDPANLTLDRLVALVNILGFELLIQDKSAPPESGW